MNALAPIGDKPVRRGPGETADYYPDVVVQINRRWRVILCPAGIQWILQKRDSGNAPSTGWRGVSYCVTREALVRLCGGLESPVDPSALLILATLPEHIPDGVGDRRNEGGTPLVGAVIGGRS